MKMLRILSCLAATVFLGAGIMSTNTTAATMTKVVDINGKNANTNLQSKYRGLGMVTGNGSSRLLLDYKDENPDQYWEIMNYLFNPDTGMGLSHIKLEMGSDVNSSSGTEPSYMRTSKEEADVTRGAGFQLTADAKKINPNITLDMLWWSEPLWVSNAKNMNAARYKWYKSTLDAAYKTYGLKFDYVSSNRNEKGLDTAWAIYLSNALKKEKNCPYDYSKIKIAAADEVTSWNLADYMLKDKKLLNAVDVLTSHYTSWSTDNAKKLNTKYGKELWVGEGCPPMNYSQSTYQYDGNGSGLSGINGMLDIATRIITMYPGGLMNLYEFQPPVASYYNGSQYFPKQLITANEPWSGYYTLDPGFYMSMHFAQFAKVGWQYINGACEGDGVAGGDGHAVVDSKYNYNTITDPKTGDYSIILANNSANKVTYTFNVSNLTKAQSPVDVWETRGPDKNQDYYHNFLKKISTITPTVNSDGTATYQYELKPYSLVTISTLKREEKDYTVKTKAAPLSLPYTDDYEYTGYDKNYLKERGSAPRYTSDEGGAFEVTNLNGNNVLQQKVTLDIKAYDWGSTPNPVTNFGDDRWTDYSVSADVLLNTKKIEKTEVSFVGVGARYMIAAFAKSGYWLQLFEDGKYQLNCDGSKLKKGKLENFDKSKWHNLKIAVNKNVITCYIDGTEVINYTQKNGISASGRAALYSSFNKNCFDNVKIEKIEGGNTYSKRFDDTDAPFFYSGAWTHDLMCSYSYFNRTNATGTKGAAVSFEFDGKGFAVLGNTQDVNVKIEIDGKVISDNYRLYSTKFRGASYFNYDLAQGHHKVKITVVSGKFIVDAFEIIE